MVWGSVLKKSAPRTCPSRPMKLSEIPSNSFSSGPAFWSLAKHKVASRGDLNLGKARAVSDSVGYRNY